MSTQASTAWMLKWAVAGVVAAAFAPLAMAQYQTNNSAGRARDANNRLGSGGYNDQRALPNGVTNEDVVYSNVTRGQGFRGALNTTDRTAFRGQTAGSAVSDFVRDSSGANQDTSQALAPKAFYPDSRGVAPPPGFETQASVADIGVRSSLDRGPTFGDLRTNVAPVNPLIDASIPQTDLSVGAVASPLTAAGAGAPPLVGMPVWQAQTGVSAEDAFAPSQRGALRRLQINESTIRMMQAELSSTAEQPQDTPGRIDTANAMLSPENPQNPSMGGTLGSQLPTPAMTGTLSTSTTMRQNLLTALPTAAKQSTQYAELQRRLHAMETGSADEISARQYNEQVRLQREAEAKANPAAALVQPGDTALPGESSEPATKKPSEATGTQLQPMPSHQRLAARQAARKAEAGTDIKPETGSLPTETVLRITTFAEGVKASGLRDLLTRAETSMRDGKFTAALDNYDAAISVAPNNPLILMARANAELGAGYYARAQTHIEQIFAADSSLLLAQYDLRVFFGDERLQYLVRDLKDVARTEPGQARPLFLLAYIAYNTNNPQSAADYLAMAEKRGGKDPVFDKLREFWKLPKAGAGDTMPDNK